MSSCRENCRVQTTTSQTPDRDARPFLPVDHRSDRGALSKQFVASICDRTILRRRSVSDCQHSHTYDSAQDQCLLVQIHVLTKCIGWTEHTAVCPPPRVQMYTTRHACSYLNCTILSSGKMISIEKRMLSTLLGLDLRSGNHCAFP
jgi:hypothetical protein